MMTSAIKRVNVAVYNVDQGVNDESGQLKTRRQPELHRRRTAASARQRARPEEVPKAYIAQTNALGKLIASGKVKVPPVVK